MSELVVDIVKEGDKFYPICPCCRNKLKYVYQRMCLKCGQILSIAIKKYTPKSC